MLLSANAAFAGDDDEKFDKLDSIVVSASRAGKSTPVTYTMVGKEELQGSNPINSLPMVLSLQPSVVTVNEGGTGLGYSKMTVRGSKGSQVNVTLNGITLNDAESQEVFWVNIPALSSLLSSVQLQRGLGTSANGAGSFGASINMSTSSVGTQPYACFEVSRGAYNTMMTTVSAGTGLTASGLYLSAAYSKNSTDGYIRNAFADVQSALVVLGWLKGDNSLKFSWLMGDQHTGITWNGVSLAQMAADRTYNGAGAYYDEMGNVRYYDNESDNYTQHHLQLNYTHRLCDALTWSSTFNYTKGDGYYEQYESGYDLSTYALSDPSGTYSSGDAIVQRIMDNYLLVLSSDLRYRTQKLDVTGGIYLSRYDGDNFGDVLWNSVLGDSYDYSDARWYFSNGLKKEFNAFVRAEYKSVQQLTAYIDLQYRGISYEITGTGDDFADLTYDTTWNFFNPRAGVTYDFNEAHKAYFSVALGHREPGRSDLEEHIKDRNAEIDAGNTPGDISLKPEAMLDFELGYNFSSPKFSASVNLYAMEYWDMLLETGKLSNVGYALKENVARSWRRGVEIAGAWMPSKLLRLDGNLTLSTNKIKDFTGYYEEYDNADDWNFLGSCEVDYGKTTMLMSPSVVGMIKLSLSPFRSRALKSTTLAVDGKYVGRQYWDSTESAERRIPAYFVSDLSLTHEFTLPMGSLGIGAYVNNLFANHYYADVWVSRVHFADTDTWEQYEGVYPQALTTLMFKVSYRF